MNCTICRAYVRRLVWQIADDVHIHFASHILVCDVTNRFGVLDENEKDSLSVIMLFWRPVVMCGNISTLGGSHISLSTIQHATYILYDTGQSKFFSITELRTNVSRCMYVPSVSGYSIRLNGLLTVSSRIRLCLTF